MNSTDVNARPIVAAVAISLMACNGAPAPPASAADTAGMSAMAPESLRARADRARVAGDTAAPLWVIEASDFQCPFCAQWHRESHAALRAEYVRAGKIRIAYLNFPLEQHPHAVPAASAALCAGAQGKFWQVHDEIFATQDRWTALADARPTFDSIAARSGADMSSWRRCVSEDVMAPVIASDRDRAAQAGVRSTPTFLIAPSKPPARQGQLIRGAAPLAEFRRVLDSMLAPSGGGAR